MVKRKWHNSPPNEEGVYWVACKDGTVHMGCFDPEYGWDIADVIFWQDIQRPKHPGIDNL